MKKILIYFVILISTITFVKNSSAAPVNSGQNLTERITEFESYITVQENSELQVREVITVFANGSKIKRGIYRDFPTKYGFFDARGIKGFKVTKVTKNGVDEPYHISNVSNGKRVYIGDKDEILSTGKYTYEIYYTTTNQLGFFEDHDELYWNVTGNEWEFPIEKTSVYITLPQKIPYNEVQTVGFVGLQGSTQNSPELEVIKQNDTPYIVGHYNQPLSNGEGYTVAVKWPKGYVQEPTFLVRYLPSWVFSIQSLLGLILFSGIFIFYFIRWKNTGRDENMPQTIPVTFAPPKNMTPGLVRVLNQMGEFDDKCISTAILNMAINGYIKISQKTKYEYQIIITEKSPADLVDDEKIIYDKMFPKDEDKQADPLALLAQIEQKETTGVIGKFLDYMKVKKDPPGMFTIGKQNATVLQELKKKVTKFTKTKQKTWIVQNSETLKYSLIPILLFILINFILVRSELADAFPRFFMIVFWNLFSIPLLFVTATKKISLSAKLGSLIFLIVFVSMAFFLSMDVFGPLGAIFFQATLIEMAIFSKALVRRTVKGRELQNHIDGFKMFIESQEDYIKRVEMDFPDRFTMYERYLPFAIALDLEPKWSAKFKDVVREALELNQNNTPTWYIGTYSGFNTTNWISNFSSSLNVSIASASTNPSSSSGFSGGSSGGGGGGGGGGGW